ncbi:MAG: AMP-binding protein, partial [Deltaproteobacteria bacterium]|nr:AMP-binding protein [Deltaproteobacteria bacterium]
MENKDRLLEYTIPQLLRRRVNETGDKVALREKDFGYWNNYTWNDYFEQVRKIALGLEQVGIKKGDKLALIGDNIPEMLFMAIGAQSTGAVSAGIYQTTLPDEIAQLINYMDVTAVFCDDQEQVDKLVEIRDQIPQVHKVIYEDPRGMRDYQSDDWYLFIGDLYEMGAAAHAENPEKYDALID